MQNLYEIVAGINGSHPLCFGRQSVYHIPCSVHRPDLQRHRAPAPCDLPRHNVPAATLGRPNSPRLYCSSGPAPRLRGGLPTHEASSQCRHNWPCRSWKGTLHSRSHFPHPTHQASSIFRSLTAIVNCIRATPTTADHAHCRYHQSPSRVRRCHLHRLRGDRQGP